MCLPENAKFCIWAEYTNGEHDQSFYAIRSDANDAFERIKSNDGLRDV